MSNKEGVREEKEEMVSKETSNKRERGNNGENQKGRIYLRHTPEMQFLIFVTYLSL